VTSVSGRGVGIDVAMTRIRALGGSVEIRTEPGKGTAFVLRLPVTLAIVRALIAAVGLERYALPLTYVAETVEFGTVPLTTMEGRDAIVLRDRVVPLVDLRKLLGTNGAAPSPPPRRPVIVLEMGERRAGIVVDGMLSQQEIVVKGFDAPQGTLPVFSGATIMGDGVPALILDAAGLVYRKGRGMEDVRDLKALQLDALREVANIGAGHAATALSQLTHRRIMISVPEINIARLEEVPGLIGDPQEVVAAVLMHMLGDLTGRTLLMFPVPVGRQLCDMLLKRPLGTTKEFETIEQSCIKEAGNILSGAYMNALSEFMGMLLLPSVPSLVVDLSAAVLTTTYLNFGHDRDFVFCVETEFNIDAQDGLRGHFLLLPDLASLKAIFDAIRLT
jgi:chemotaxis protein CheC